MRYKVKLEHDPTNDTWPWKASLYEDHPNSKLLYVTASVASTSELALLDIRRKRNAIETKQDPVWYTLDDEIVPQSLKAV